MIEVHNTTEIRRHRNLEETVQLGPTSRTQSNFNERFGTTLKNITFASHPSHSRQEYSDVLMSRASNNNTTVLHTSSYITSAATQKNQMVADDSRWDDCLAASHLKRLHTYA